MMMCSRCHKRPAVVFVATGQDSSPTGLCLKCAKEVGIKPVSDLMDQMGISDEQMEEVESRLSALINPDGGEDGEDSEDGFTPGGAATFPF